MSTTLTEAEWDALADASWQGVLLPQTQRAVEALLAAREREAAERAWDESVRECHDLGWMHDFARSDALARNPYRNGATR